MVSEDTVTIDVHLPPSHTVVFRAGHGVRGSTESRVGREAVVVY